MKTGDMRERVSFLRDTRTQTDDGGFTVTATTLGTVRAAVRAVAANEREEAGRLFGATSYMFTIHARDMPAGLTTGDAVSWLTAPGGSAVTMQIRGIRQQIGRTIFLEIVGEAGAVV
jgi:head-tail adaptor